MSAGPSLLGVALRAPLGLIDPDDPSTVHAATMEAVIAGWPLSDDDREDPRIEAPCGATGKLFVEDGRVLVWPIRAAGPLTRCRECWVATGKRRPRKASA